MTAHATLGVEAKDQVKGGTGMAKASVKVDGQKIKDGEIVTLIVQAKVSIRDRVAYNGEKVRDVEFQSLDEFGYVYLEADTDAKSKFELPGVTIVKVKG